MRVDVLAVDVKRIGIAAVTQSSGIEVGAARSATTQRASNPSQMPAHGSRGLLIALGSSSSASAVDASDNTAA